MWRKLFMIIIIVALGAGVALWRMYSSGRLQEVVAQKVGERVIKNPSEMNLLYQALGFREPQTYLVLFLNNTELRPGGGFIGAYATVRIDKGRPHILKVEGTETLDNMAPKDFLSPPPEPLRDYLKVKRWNFRDSNWSPDFASSAAKALELYIQEGGTAASDVRGVIGITPTVVEEILKISGPIAVNGQTYDAGNVTRKLEYEVEYGYARRGLSFDDRKKELADLTRALLSRLRFDVFTKWSRYFGLIERMAREKHLIAYSSTSEAPSILKLKGWSGQMKESSGDFLLWADANLASLKTDLSIKRELSYKLTPFESARAGATSTRFIASVKMKYKHEGRFDQFTTRYRTYARLFVPPESEFVKVTGSMRNDRTSDPGTVDKGVENGRQWFGTFIAVEPGQTGELEWQYFVAPEIAAQINDGRYNLLVQKQIGTLAVPLTLDLNFGKKVVFASPGELRDRHGDARYQLETDLREDKEFAVRME